MCSIIKATLIFIMDNIIFHKSIIYIHIQNGNSTNLLYVLRTSIRHNNIMKCDQDLQKTTKCLKFIYKNYDIA
jgi:hypothetical protein